MPVNNGENEPKTFAHRLETLLQNKGKRASPTALARDFNLRWRGAPVTVNATRKWLRGHAIPTMDKLTVLANLLNTSQDWLRWGVPTVQEPVDLSYDHSVSVARGQLREAQTSFSQDFQLLNVTNQKLVSAVMVVLLSEQRKTIQANRKNWPPEGQKDVPIGGA